MAASEDPGRRAIGLTVSLRGHFSRPVRIEGLEPVAEGLWQLRVREDDGSLAETVIAAPELETALADAAAVQPQVPAGAFFRLVEGNRIRLAYAHDPYFAVSMSGVRGLPHQIEAVYRHLLPQPLLRTVLADDPGAGKTIMGGLLLKELKLRGVVERVLVVAPAPLTVQWQDELYDKFDEWLERVDGNTVRYQMGGNAWTRYAQVVTSLDFAKQEDVTPELLRAEWDLVIIDEAHKCSAFTASNGDIRRTRRYALAEELSKRTERLLLLTATPHSGDADRFSRFMCLLDADQFSTPELTRRQIALEESPYFLRRAKEDLVDEHGRALFVDRSVVTQPFTLSEPERHLYLEVTNYVNQFLAGGAGRGNAVALARTVLQRRLASSLGAIRSSLQRRGNRLSALLDELESLPPVERRRRLADLQRLPGTDDETADDDADEEMQERAITDVSVAEQLDELRVEIAELGRLTALAERTMEEGDERKLVALDSCLQRSELAELRDGRGKLLIFTEHRDTLEYLVRHLERWGYSTCSIHGGHAPVERKRIQHDFRTKYQVCVATEAAGEGINLQFCHLMVNYDLPWNPVRLEQRMGRIHRIGQQSKCVVVNFCATNTVEGRLLERLHDKLEEMRADLQGRVYDVIGDLLDHNGLDFERLVKDTLANPQREVAALEQISALSPELLRRYEQDIGVAQATRTVDLAWVRQRSVVSEERRLMPEYVERFFLDAAGAVGCRVEQRASDRLYRVEHVPRSLRSDDLDSVRRGLVPTSEYRKLTFRKEDRFKAEHEDADLCSPGHPLFSAVSERLTQQLRVAGVPGGVATFVDPDAREGYVIHFLTYEVVGETENGRSEVVFSEVVAVAEQRVGGFALLPAHILHDLTQTEGVPTELDRDQVRAVESWVRADVQRHRSEEQRATRLGQAELRRRYLEEAISAQRLRLEDRWAELDERVHSGADEFRLARDEVGRRIDELERRRRAKVDGFERLGIVRAGPLTYLGAADVLPPAGLDERDVTPMRSDAEVEQAAMSIAMAFEREAGWEPEDVSSARDGSGFDIRSTRINPETGELEVRRIEVKGRSGRREDVGLYRTEWFAAQRFRAGFWLYVVYGAARGEEQLIRIQDPYGALDGVEEIAQITGYRVPAASIEAVQHGERKQRGSTDG
jgi:superfamily II DNA or RNA helicase